MTSDSVSVVVPCFKQAEYLPEAVQSVVEQTHRRWEIVIVDDGSPDATAEVARRLGSEHPECTIRLIRKPNGGLADARNRGIEAAVGPWILPLDADDRLAPECLEQLLAAAAEPGVNLVCPAKQEFGTSQTVVRYPPFDAERLRQENLYHCSCLFPKSLWQAAGGYEPTLPFGLEDWDFWLRCSAVGLCARVLAEPLFLYRRTEGASMIDRLAPRVGLVEAMLRTLHPAQFDPRQLLTLHALIGISDDETLAEISRKIERFPDRHPPYLWRGLIYKRRKSLDLAYADFETGASLASEGDWQAAWHLFETAMQQRRHADVQRILPQLLEQHAYLPWVKDVSGAFGAAKSRSPE
ncbi:MAG: glycosyltransferase [Bdellovibrionales bacterium]|nr:glycosyltransferase [Bdellovibrionales bacterium]